MTHIDGEKAGLLVMCALMAIYILGACLWSTHQLSWGLCILLGSILILFSLCIGKLQDATPDISSYAFHLQSECLAIIILFVELHVCLFFLFTFVISIVFVLGALV